MGRLYMGELFTVFYGMLPNREFLEIISLKDRKYTILKEFFLVPNPGSVLLKRFHGFQACANLYLYVSIIFYII